MYTRLSHIVAEQHIEDLRGRADRSRLAAQGVSERPTLAIHLMRAGSAAVRRLAGAMAQLAAAAAAQLPEASAISSRWSGSQDRSKAAGSSGSAAA